MNITIIGGGNMGLTYALSIHKNYEEAQISVLEKDTIKINELKETTPFLIHDNPEDCVLKADIILIAVKPQVAVKVFRSLKEFMRPNQIVISIMAGVTIDTIIKGLDAPKIVRAMPNLPAQVGQGVTGYMVSNAIIISELEIIQKILGATGKAIRVYKEDDIDAITALSGSGPAYVFYFMNAMMEQALTYGFSENDAKDIVLHTFLGTSTLFKKSNDDAQVWIDRVTSKGGTTHAALTNFKDDNLKSKIKQGIDAAFIRAKELAKS